MYVHLINMNNGVNNNLLFSILGEHVYWRDRNSWSLHRHLPRWLPFEAIPITSLWSCAACFIFQYFMSFLLRFVVLFWLRECQNGGSNGTLFWCSTVRNSKKNWINLLLYNILWMRKIWYIQIFLVTGTRVNHSKSTSQQVATLDVNVMSTTFNRFVERMGWLTFLRAMPDAPMWDLPQITSLIVLVSFHLMSSI